MITFHILTLFPDLYPGPLGCSVLGNALDKKIFSLNILNIRDFANDKHKTVDDRPFGGGAGMVLKPDIIHKAIYSVYCEKKTMEIIYMSPRGEVLNQSISEGICKNIQDNQEKNEIIIICGRFEGVDQRILDTLNIREISIGDYILCGGDVAAMAMLESVIRLIPEVLGSKDSLNLESFTLNLLESPHYTRPVSWQGKVVPEILRSGDHEKINQWRLRQAETTTKERRPDLWLRYLKEKGE